MSKFLLRISVATFIVVLAAALAVFCLSAEAQVAPHLYTVVFKFKQKPANEVPDPDIRIYVMISGRTEGEAAINAQKNLAEKLTAQAVDRLDFVEAARKD